MCIRDSRNTLIIMTSNAGADTLGERFASAHDQGATVEEAAASEAVASEAHAALAAFLRPEFINRIDEVVVFHPLGEEHTRAIVGLQLAGLKDRLQAAGIQLKATQETVDWLSQQGHDPQYGARPVKRLIERMVLNPLSRALLAGEIDKGATSVMDIFDGKVVFRQPIADEALIAVS